MADRTQHVVQPPGGPTALVAVPAARIVHVFHQVGTVGTTVSDDFPAMIDGIASLALARLTTPGTSDSLITIYINDVSVGVITIPAGVNVGSVDLANTVTFSVDWFSVAATTPGTGSGGLWVGVYV